MKEVFAFLQAAKTFYIATVEGDQPRVRPFGAVCEFEDKIYIITANTKKVYAQIKANPKVEVCGMAGGKWIRLAAELVEDDRREAREAMMAANPSLKNMYTVDDGKMVVFYFKNATADICSFTEPTVTYQF